jgi:hypothetical protein
MEVSPFNGFKTIIDRLEWALLQLNCKPSHTQLEKWAMLLMENMSGPHRMFHRPHHILMLSENMDPIQTIAALYHDIVYFQVDGGISPAIQASILNYFRNVNGAIYVSEMESDIIFDMVLGVFGYQKEQKLLAYSGQNEFLSALVALRELEDMLTLPHLLMVAVCIEATIPFRGKENIFLGLKKRLEHLNENLKIGLSPADIKESIRKAILLANKDVENFTYQDAGRFLDNTWLLLPESNKKLNEHTLYTIKEYRIALQNMEHFLGGLDAQRIIYNFQNALSAQDYKDKMTQADKNLHIARVYLGVKLYELAILEAMAHLTGGDVPLMYFVGDIVNRPKSPKRIEHYLTKYPTSPHMDHNPDILTLLEKGRASESSFDTKNSMLAAYLYANLGEKTTMENAKDAKRFFAGEISGKNFLLSQEQSLIKDIAQAASHLACTRKDKLLLIPNLPTA